MKRIKIFHNPGAGGLDTDKQELISLFEEEGYECAYSSTKKKDKEEAEPRYDFMVVAGGDGTVRKIAKQFMLKETPACPVAVIPLGTANNIFKTLGLTGTVGQIVKQWKKGRKKSFDAGILSGTPEPAFFIESFGFGMFPYLVKKIKQYGTKHPDAPKPDLRKALKLLYKVASFYKPRECKLTINGVDYSGNYLLVEVMNIPSMGPNLVLSKESDPGDGTFEVVMIPEDDREKFKSYIRHKLDGGLATPPDFITVKAKKVEISWGGKLVHADDEMLKMKKGTTVKVEVQRKAMEFMV